MSGETEQNVSGWTVDTLHTALVRQLTASEEYTRTVMDERDRRYEERFVAQQLAVQTGLVAAEKAVQAALTAAKEAVDKAEVANAKRFDSVNEFRGQLNDQAASFMPRSESETKYEALTEKLDTAITVLREQISTIQHVQAISAGSDQGRTANQDDGARNRQMVYGTIAAIASVFGIVAIILAIFANTG